MVDGWLRWLSGLAVAGLLLAGCGGSDEDTSAEDTDQDTAETDDTGDSADTDATDDTAETVTDPPPEPGAGPEVGDHFHHAFAIQYCGEFEPPPEDTRGDLTGIHTHGDGVIHVHPFEESVTGEDATLGVFLDEIGARIGEETELPGGESIRIGDDECGDELVDLRVAYWENALAAADGAPPDAIYTEDVDEIPLQGDLGAYTIAFEPPGTEIEAPPSAADICELALVDGGRVGERCE